MKRCKYHDLPYIVQAAQGWAFYKPVKPELRRNTWILTVGSNNPITSSQVLEDIKSNQIDNKTNTIEMWISKRNEQHIKKNQDRWATFNQMKMIQNWAICSDAIDVESVKENTNENRHSNYRKYNTSGYKIINIKVNGETKILKGKGEKVTDDFQDEKEEDIYQIVIEQPEKLSMTLKNEKIPNYKTISKPKHDMLIQLPMKSKKPELVKNLILFYENNG